MRPEDLLAGLRERGVTVTRDGGDLILDEPDETREVLTEKLLASIRRHKATLLALLAHEEDYGLSPESAAPSASSTWGEHGPPLPQEGELPDWEREEHELRECASAECELPEHEPPQPEPYHPSWGGKRATWNARLGLWQRCGGIVVTEATRENYARYYACKRARREAEQVQARPPAPAEGANDPFRQQVLALDVGRERPLYPV